MTPLRPVMPHLFVAVVCLLSSIQALSQAPPFNWKLLEGTWSESTRHQFGCRSDNVQFRIVPNSDRSRITFKYDRPKLLDGGKEVREYGAEVRRAENHSLFVKYDKDDAVMSSGEWELRFLGPGVYRMGFNGWDKATYNNVFGVKCGP